VLKHKSLIMVSVLVLVLAVVAMSCAPAKPATPPPAPPVVTPTPPTPPAPPATTTPPAATTPPPAVAAPIKTSFEANTYTNSAPAFSIMYPKTWIKKEVTAPDVFGTARDTASTASALTVTVIDKAADFAAAAKNQLDNSATFKQYSAKAKVDSTAQATLADGKTAASVVELSTKLVIYDVYLYAVGVNIGDKTVMAIIYTVDKGKDQALIQEIAKTLSAK
jgi:hypothetical protein